MKHLLEDLAFLATFVLPWVIGFAAFIVGGLKAMGPDRPEKPIGFWRPWFALLVGCVCALVFGLGSCALAIGLANVLSSND